MSSTVRPTFTCGNQLLSALRPEDYEQLARHLEQVSLSLGQVLYLPDEPIRYVYFPESAVISLLATMENGGTVEVGLVGREGMLGIRILLGVRKTPHTAMVQADGSALRMTVNQLEKELKLGSPLQALLLRFTQAMLTQVRQLVACNAQHSINQRLARWLLMMQDYTRKDEMRLTQDLLSMMMGARRASVSEAASKLQKAGAIQYRRGNLIIVERKSLEQAACECYRIIKQEYGHLYKSR
jgi:CRP-like cAMP-binding protein